MTKSQTYTGTAGMPKPKTLAKSISIPIVLEARVRKQAYLENKSWSTWVCEALEEKLGNEQT